MNASWLGLYARESLAEDASVAAAGEGFEGFALAHNVASADEVDELMRQAVSAGATMARRPRQASWGGYSGYFKDPDGHLWEIAHNPHLQVGPGDDR